MSDKNYKRDTNNIKVIDKAVEILELISDKQNEKNYGVSEIAEKLHMSKTTVSRILSSLLKHDLVKKNETNKKYSIGWGIHRMSSASLSNEIGDEKIQSYMHELGNITKETVSLAYIDGLYALIIDTYYKGIGLRVDTASWTREPLHATALGKALLIDHSKLDLEKLYKDYSFHSYTDNTILTLDCLYEDIQTSCKRGYTISNEEYASRVIGYAVPLRNYKNEIVAAMSISGPIQISNQNTCRFLISELKKSALNASKQLGFKGNEINSSY